MFFLIKLMVLAGVFLTVVACVIMGIGALIAKIMGMTFGSDEKNGKKS